MRLQRQHTFYAVMCYYEVLLLLGHHHKFMVEEVIDQYELHYKGPVAGIDPDTNIEIQTYKQFQLEAYNEYKSDDIGLSRLVVKSLLALSLMERYGNE